MSKSENKRLTVQRPITVSLVENIVQTPPDRMYGWRFYRIEYSNGLETAIWLPANVNAIDIEHMIEMSQ